MLTGLLLTVALLRLAASRTAWFDDFNEPLNDSRWLLVDAGGGFGNGELQYYRPQNAAVSNGTLKIHARLEPYSGHAYTSAKVITIESWTRGIFSVRARFSSARGTWPAAWLLPSREAFGSWPRSGEADVFESVGFNRTFVRSTVHTEFVNGAFGPKQFGEVELDTAVWHVYSLLWNSSHLTFSVDGDVYYSFSKRQALRGNPPAVASWPFNRQFYLILNLAVGGNWGGAMGVDERAFSGAGQWLEVDWVSVEDA